MSLPAPWLATLVEQCLGSYADQGQSAHDGIEVEDNGTTLCFKRRDITSVAAIFEWDIGPSHDGARLIDADNQVLARFPHSLSDPSLLTPNTHSKETNPKKHRIQLLDFELVFTYSASTPDVWLNVSRFRINWEEGIIKGLTPKKILRRNLAVKVLLDKALQKAKSKGLASKPTEASNLPSQTPRPLDQHPPQSQGHPHHDTQSQQMFSQIPSRNYDVGQRALDTDRRLLYGANELLQHLDPSSRPSSRNSAGSSMQVQGQTTRATMTRGPLHVLADGEPSANGVRRSASPVDDRSGRADSISSQPRNSTVNTYEPLEVDTPLSEKVPNTQSVGQRTTSPLPNPDERADARLSSKVASRSPSRKRHRESVELQSDLALGDRDSPRSSQGANANSLSRKRQRVNETIQEKSPMVSPDQRVTEVSPLDRNKGVEQNLKTAIDPPRVIRNPWQGLAQIRACDVNIPKDQLELLDGDLCWIPPAPGKSQPCGHVPARLLKQWNNIAWLRHEINHGDARKTPIEEDPATPISSRQTSPSSEDESDEELCSQWSTSPLRGPQDLPPESSPIRQPMPLRRVATHKGDSEKETLDNSPRTTDSKGNSQSLGQIPGPPQKTLETSTADVPLPNELEKSRSGNPMISGEDIVKDPEPSGDGETYRSPACSSVDPLNSTTLISEEDEATDSENSESAAENSEDEDQSDDASDEESVMENSVPYALGESLPPTQSSQVEQELIGYTQPLSQVTRDHVQVAVTPSAVDNRPQGNLGNNPKNSSQPQFSSQSNKNSSQSRVPNTYPYLGSFEKSLSSDDPTTSSSLRSALDASRAEVAVPQTQTSGINSQSQDTYDPSPHEVVFESSEPSQQHLEVPSLNSNPSAELLMSSVDSTSSQRHDQTHEPMTQLSFNESISPPQMSSIRQFNSSAASPYESPIKSPPAIMEEVQQDPCEQDIQATLATQSAELVARRSGFIGDLQRSVEAQEVYKKFCNDYPGYTGDYGHFTELCSKLQAVRAQGLLLRSNLWDDFIIMHIQQYPSYLDSYTTQQSTQPQNYENYFMSNVSKSENRKRSLSGYTIEVVASQFARPEATPTQASTQVDPPLSQTSREEDMNTSLAASFVDRFSHFHAHSFEEPVRNGLPVFQSGLPALDGHATSSMDTGSSSILIKLEGSELDPNEALCTQIAPMSSFNDTSAPYNPQPGTTEGQPTDSQSITKSQNIANSQRINVQDEQDDVSMAEVEETDDEEELDADDTRHETASVELGDDTFISAAPQSHADEVAETQPECEDEDEGENWFVSLRHMRSRDKPVWSDDPKTPFKIWAEADQNVLSERRRRGGAKILLDENGVIRRPTRR
ncbi:uncharacterized protein N7496_000921 [Penicillium cataractarum]|uniref:Telomere replication protein EST3 n=1 Tax=Penicillium cataractarum TaxID=2100454 RepID=A0A9X0B6E5_9EURO|nr:uncharacterized protein N7496_000921 [Penicillium cataractarum]KAJ5389853.1 hypothetical protein N7496_000921 [Penicillium cataractarum]